MDKPFSPACENNRDPILALLMPLLADKSSVLEIGSGTGQHAVWFAKNMPQLRWQTSDLQHNHAGINQWLNAYPSPNLLAPIELDMLDTVGSNWPNGGFDCIYSANTAHIMPWEAVVNMLAQAGLRLCSNGLFCLYGPMQYQGVIEPQSNRDFDASLQQQASHMGIREFHQINRLAAEAGLVLLDDHAMPANNRLLVWQKA
jgi:predicted O-methyltransferase YrrM